MNLFTINSIKTKCPGIFLILSFFLVAFRFSGNDFTQEDLRSSILNRHLCVAEPYNSFSPGDSSQQSIIKIPSDAVFKYLSKRISNYKYRVVKVKIASEEVRLKSLCVSFIKEDSGYMVVSGLNPGDSLLIDPQGSLKELVKIDKLGLRKAFSSK